MDYTNKHYIRTNENNEIIHYLSDAFEQPQPYDVLINEQGGRHFELLGQTNPALTNMQGIYLYKYVNEQIIVKSQ